MGFKKISNFSQRSRGFHAVRGGNDRTLRNRFISPFLSSKMHKMTSGTGTGPYLPRVELAL